MQNYFISSSSTTGWYTSIGRRLQRGFGSLYRQDLISYVCLRFDDYLLLGDYSNFTRIVAVKLFSCFDPFIWRCCRHYLFAGVNYVINENIIEIEIHYDIIWEKLP